jgi:23S rRNA (uridine2552-2'-O)-methyltransferase
MNDRFHFIKSGSTVLDLGAAPGGWLEVSSQLVGNRGKVVGVDMYRIEPLPTNNVSIMRDDITSTGFADRIKTEIGRGKADAVLADLSPKLSGVWDMDHFRQIDLCHRVMDLLPEILSEDGSIVIKAFQGDELNPLIARIRKSFQKCEIIKPDASRKQSSEVYLFGRGFSGQVSRRETEDQQEELRYESHSDYVASD